MIDYDSLLMVSCGIGNAGRQVVRKCLYLQPTQHPPRRDADSVRSAGLALTETWKAKLNILININKIIYQISTNFLL